MNQLLGPLDAPRIKFSGTPEQAKEVILEHISEISHISQDSIYPYCSLSHDLSLDSLDKTELIMWCEMTFDVAINHDEVSDTVGDILKAVTSKL